MKREELLKQIAETGYNVGYAAKKHFATVDVVDKIPGWISFISLAIGVFALVNAVLGEKYVAATLVVSAVAALYMSFYDKTQYASVGKELTGYFHELRTHYALVKSLPADVDATPYLAEYIRIRTASNQLGLSKQIFLSDWVAHYKFFWQQQIGWLDDELHFTFWRDKIPLTMSITGGVAIIVPAVVLVQRTILA